MSPKLTSVVSRAIQCGELAAVGQERDEDRAGERNQQDERENGLVDVRSFSVPRSVVEEELQRLAGEYDPAGRKSRSTAAPAASQAA